VPKIKGSHNAMKSGMLAAEAAFEALTSGRRAARQRGAGAFPQTLRVSSWVYEELHRRAQRQAAFKWGLWPAIAYHTAGIDT
jgi:electron-transferring-flavoprotein dehydrogenase